MDRHPVPLSKGRRPEETGAPPVPRLGRLVYAAIWLGMVLPVGSAGVVWLTRHSRADAPSAGGEPSRVERRAVAVAYVDIDGGVANLYTTRAGRVVEVPAEEGKEVEKGAPLLRVDDTLAQHEVAQAKIALA